MFMTLCWNMLILVYAKMPLHLTLQVILEVRAKTNHVRSHELTTMMEHTKQSLPT